MEGMEGVDQNILILIPAIAAIIANFIEIKPDDSGVVKSIKKVINLLGLNITQKAGK